MVVYTNNVPQANQKIATTQPIINSNFDYTQKAVGQEHNFIANDTDPTHTYHKQASMPNRVGGDPVALPSGTNGIYYVNNSGARFYDGTTISRLTEGSPIANGGYQWIGKVLYQWGFSSSLTFPIIITFPTPFPTACFNVQTTLTSANSSPSNTGNLSIVKGVGTPSTTAFSAFFVSSSGSYTGFYWTAIGN